MNANIMNETIEMTKTEAKAAGILNSEKFNELKDLRAEFPGYSIVVVKSTAKNKERFKGLTLQKMESYIVNHDEDKSNLKKFYTLRGLDENGKKNDVNSMVEPKTYGEIKAWFLGMYPEIEEFVSKADDILAEAKEKRAAAKAA